MSKAKPVRTKIVLLTILALNVIGFGGWQLFRLLYLELDWFAGRFLSGIDKVHGDKIILAVILQVLILGISFIVPFFSYLILDPCIRKIYKKLDRMFPDRKGDSCG